MRKFTILTHVTLLAGIFGILLLLNIRGLSDVQLNKEQLASIYKCAYVQGVFSGMQSSLQKEDWKVALKRDSVEFIKMYNK